MKRIPCPSAACRNGMERVDETHSKLCDTCGGDGSILTTDDRAERYSKELDRLTVAIIKMDLQKLNTPLHVRRQSSDIQARAYLAEQLRCRKENQCGSRSTRKR